MDTPAAGATPESGAMPGTPTTPTPPAAAPAPPATGDDAMATDAGKRALAEERTARKAAETAAKAATEELEQLRNATASDAEKATKAKVDEALKVEREKYAGERRQLVSEVVKVALAASGVSEKELALAANAPEFAGLDDVSAVAATVDKFRTDHPALFAPAAGGGVTRGPQQPKGGEPPKGLEDAISAHYSNH